MESKFLRLIAILAEFYSDEEIALWLTSGHDALPGRGVALDMIERGKIDEVMVVAEQMADLAYI